jgi:hypothetical protein
MSLNGMERPPTDQSAGAIAAMLDAFEAAAARDPAGAPVEFYRFVDQPVRTRVAGSRLARTITRAFTHLRSEPSCEAALTISLWDGEETGIAPPMRHLRDVFYRTWPFGMSVLAASPDERMVGLQSHAVTMVYSRPARQIVGWVASPDRLSLFERGKPLQPLLFAWQSDLDVMALHASFVAKDGRGVLFGGAGGSGKSTASLLCLAAGFDYLGDDYIAVPWPLGRWPKGFSVYASAWLEPDHARHFPWILSHAVRGAAGEDKLLVLLPEFARARIRGNAEIMALALPRVAATRETLYRPATKGEALRRLAPSSILQLPFVARRHALSRMTEVISRVPTYWFDLGRDLDGIPARVAEILAEAITRDRGAAARTECAGVSP